MDSCQGSARRCLYDADNSAHFATPSKIAGTAVESFDVPSLSCDISSQLRDGLMNRAHGSGGNLVNSNQHHSFSGLTLVQRGEIMKKILTAIVVLSLIAGLSGCIVVPSRGGYYGHPHYYRGW